jgi:hypothetical protein
MHAADVLAETARRLTADLATRFPGIEVTLTSTSAGLVSVHVNRWGSSAEFDWFGDELDEVDLEGVDFETFVETAALEIADNLWPDELVDPWPLCPQHRDHPLQVALQLGTAAWVCLREPTTAIRVGDLPAP